MLKSYLALNFIFQLSWNVFYLKLKYQPITLNFCNNNMRNAACSEYIFPKISR